MLRNLLFVGIGGAAGSMMRYAVTLLTARLHGTANVATLLVNVAGSMLMGWLMAHGVQGSRWMLFATVGLCGGFTTFSTFSMQTVTLLDRGRISMAFAYAAATLILCLLCCWAGYRLGTKG